MRDVSLYNSGQNAGPNQSFHNRLFPSVEAVQIGIGFPFLEQKFHLPAESVQVSNVGEGECADPGSYSSAVP